MSKLPENWRKANTMFYPSKRGKEILQNYRKFNPNSISKTLEQSIKQHICRHLENGKKIRLFAQGHVRNKSYQVDLISFCDSKADIRMCFIQCTFNVVPHDIHKQAKQIRTKLNSYKVDMYLIGKQDSEKSYLLPKWDNISQTSRMLSGTSSTVNFAINYFINDMNNRLTQFTNNAHLGGLANSMEARIFIQKNSLTLQEWLEINMIQLIEEKYKEIRRVQTEKELQ